MCVFLPIEKGSKFCYGCPVDVDGSFWEWTPQQLNFHHAQNNAVGHRHKSHFDTAAIGEWLAGLIVPGTYDVFCAYCKRGLSAADVIVANLVHPCLNDEMCGLVYDPALRRAVRVRAD